MVPGFARKGIWRMRLEDRGQYFARYRWGRVEIVALSDGYVDMPVTRLRKPQNQPLGNDLPKAVPLHDGKLRLAVNAFLIVTNDRSILIDTGASNAWLPTMGRLHDAMQEAGLDPRAIETVALTHTHEDHVNGLIGPDGSDGFPNLQRLWLPKAEVNLFLQFKRLAKFQKIFKAVDNGVHIAPGVIAVAAYGHEIGHTAYRVATDDGHVLIWGDIVHVPKVQFSRPELTWELDADQDAARATRLSLLNEYAGTPNYIAGAHIDFPGIGTIKHSGEGFGFSPI